MEGTEVGSRLVEHMQPKHATAATNIASKNPDNKVSTALTTMAYSSNADGTHKNNNNHHVAANGAGGVATTTCSGSHLACNGSRNTSVHGTVATATTTVTSSTTTTATRSNDGSSAATVTALPSDTAAAAVAASCSAGRVILLDDLSLSGDEFDEEWMRDPPAAPPRVLPHNTVDGSATSVTLQSQIMTKSTTTTTATKIPTSTSHRCTADARATLDDDEYDDDNDDENDNDYDGENEDDDEETSENGLQGGVRITGKQKSVHCGTSTTAKHSSTTTNAAGPVRPRRRCRSSAASAVPNNTNTNNNNHHPHPPSSASVRKGSRSVGSHVDTTAALMGIDANHNQYFLSPDELQHLYDTVIEKTARLHQL